MTTRYRLSMPEPHTHLFEVEVEVERPGGDVELVFPVWTPGSYLVREYARHVEGLAASDGDGAPLPLDRLDKHRVRVRAGRAARAAVRYRVYANELSVRTAHLDGTHGYVNGAAVFPFVAGRERAPHALEVVAPAGWRVSTALEGGPTAFTARDYDELADSPLEIGEHRLVHFMALGRPHEIAIWGRGNLDEGRLAGDARAIVETFSALMGGLPYERYVFIVHLTEKRRGGLEHARSTTLNVARTAFFPREAYEETLGLLAHEFFHLWNVKRMRPAALVPFDYAREQYTRLLWWFEGATSYYEKVALARAGILEPKRWLKALGQALTALERTPGARKMSVEEASFLAWVKHYRPDENSPNSAISYYLKGELVALALDLELRRRGKSLDDVLHRLYARHAGPPSGNPSPPTPPASGGGGQGAGVPEDGVEQVVAELLGRETAKGFFDLHVRGTEPLRLDLGVVGLRLRRRPAGAFDDKGGTPPKPEDGKPAAGFLGVELDAGPKLVVKSVREGSPAHAAGLYAEDEIVAEDGFRVDRGALWDRLCERGPGGKLRLAVFRRDELVDVQVVLGPPAEDAIWLEPDPEATAEQRAAFEAWCGGRWPAGR
ncbi:MAG TPA: PDZ domain-containing protein [Anaeromyxobacter sp.]|nr:PDZ domain-containing protein [Anaeromyxobacter sp.]